MRIAKKCVIFHILFLGLFLTAAVVSGQTPQSDTTEPIKEIHKAIYIDAYGPELTSHINAKKGIDRIKDAYFDTIFVQVRNFGKVFYNSVLEPRSARIDPGYLDPLLDFLLLCKEESGLGKSIKVYAWISLFPVHSGEISQIPPNGNIMQRHPEWISVNYSGELTDHNKIYHLDPGIPAVQDYTVTMILELVKKYELDGILLDHFHYPDDGLNWGYSAGALAAYAHDTGLTEKPLPYDPRWCDWRRLQLNKLLEKIYTNVWASMKKETDPYKR